IGKWVKALDLASNAAFVGAGIELRDGANPRNALFKRFPACGCVVAKRRDHADAGYCHTCCHVVSFSFALWQRIAALPGYSSIVSYSSLEEVARSIGPEGRLPATSTPCMMV